MRFLNRVFLVRLFVKPNYVNVSRACYHNVITVEHLTNLVILTRCRTVTGGSRTGNVPSLRWDLVS